MAALRRSSEENFSVGKYYDAQQDVKTIYRRLCAKAQYAEAIKYCVEQVARFTAASEYELAIDLGKDLVSSLVLRKEPPSEENLSALEAILGGLPQSAAPTPKYALMSQALKWSNAFTQHGHPRLHKLAAMSHWADGSYGKCQGHYVFCGDGAGLAKMVREWQQQGYAIERDLFSLRTLLILLSMSDKKTARSFWDAVTEGDVPNLKSEETVIDSQATSPEPVLQCGTFFLAAVESRSIKFFRIVRGKYALVIRRDRTFDKYLDVIEAKVLGSRVAAQQNGIGALFELLLGSGGGSSTT